MARPEFKPTAEQRRKVAIAAGAGMSHEQIAIALNISRGTLEKHFAHELSHGAYEKRLEVVTAMHRAAKKGNVAAAKAYMLMEPHIGVPPLPTADDAAKKPEKLGKKEQARRDATTAAQGTDWDKLLPPNSGSTSLQ